MNGKKFFIQIALLFFILNSSSHASYISKLRMYINTSVTCVLKLNSDPQLHNKFRHHLKTVDDNFIPLLNQENTKLSKLYQKFFKDRKRKQTMEQILNLELNSIDELLHAESLIQSKEDALKYLLTLRRYQTRPKTYLSFDLVEWPFAGFFNFTNTHGRHLQVTVKSKNEYLEIARDLAELRLNLLSRWNISEHDETEAIISDDLSSGGPIYIDNGVEFIKIK